MDEDSLVRAIGHIKNLRHIVVMRKYKKSGSWHSTLHDIEEQLRHDLFERHDKQVP